MNRDPFIPIRASGAPHYTSEPGSPLKLCLDLSSLVPTGGACLPRRVPVEAPLTAHGLSVGRDALLGARVRRALRGAVRDGCVHSRCHSNQREEIRAGSLHRQQDCRAVGGARGRDRGSRRAGRSFGAACLVHDVGVDGELWEARAARREGRGPVAGRRRCNSAHAAV
jgi:hypothetical protein